MIADSQQIQSSVLERVTDELLLQSTLYVYRIVDSQEVTATVAPLMVDHVQLRATVINQAFSEAAAGKVLAPAAQLEFTKEETDR